MQAQTRKETMVIPKSEINAKDKYRLIYIQGKRYQVERGKYVQVNPIVKEVEEAAAQHEYVGTHQEKDLALEG